MISRVHGDWLNQARCAAKDVPGDLDYFFADSTQEQAALRYCSRCPVAWECLSYALHTGMNHGVWGGLTEEKRKQFSRGSNARLDDKARVVHRRLMVELNATALRKGL